MDFTLTSEQTALADSIARFVQREYGFETRNGLVTSAEGFSPAHWASFAELGWLGAGLSEAQGGFGGGPIENALIAEHLAKGLVVEPFMPAVLALQTLAALDDFPDRADLIAAIVLGKRHVVLAHDEAEAAACIATPDGPGFYLTGARRLVLGGPSADSLLVPAWIGDDIGLFLVAGDAPGLARSDYRLLDNRRASDLVFTAVQGRRLGVGHALPAIRAGLDHALVVLCAESLGAMETALWLTRDYARTRQQFGRAIGAFQGYQFRMADMLVQCELARSMLYQALAAIGAPGATRRVAAAAAMIGEAGLFVGQQAIQLHGGIGMTEECVVGHYYKRLFVNAHLFGSRDQHITRFAA